MASCGFSINMLKKKVNQATLNQKLKEEWANYLAEPKKYVLSKNGLHSMKSAGLLTDINTFQLVVKDR